MSNDLGPRFVFTMIVLLAVIVGLIAWDLWQDYLEGAGGYHVLVEFVVLLLATSGIVMLFSWLYRERIAAQVRRRDLGEARPVSQGRACRSLWIVSFFPGRSAVASW